MATVRSSGFRSIELRCSAKMLEGSLKDSCTSFWRGFGHRVHEDLPAHRI